MSVSNRQFYSVLFVVVLAMLMVPFILWMQDAYRERIRIKEDECLALAFKYNAKAHEAVTACMESRRMMKSVE